MPLHTIEVPTFIYFFCYGTLIVTMQELILERTCLEQQIGRSVCADLSNIPEELEEDAKLVQDKSTRTITGVNVVITLASVVTSQVFGTWMDRYSRKVIVLSGLFAELMMVLGLACISGFQSLPITVIFLAAAVFGILGGPVVFKSAIYSYMLSVTPVEKRTVRLGVLEAMVYLGAAMGLVGVNLATSYLTQNKTWVLTGVIALAGMNVVISIAFVRDYSINGLSNEKAHRGVCMSVVDKFSASVKATFRKREGLRGFIVTTVIIDFFTSFILTCDVDLSYVYLQATAHYTFNQFLGYYTVKSLLEGASLVVILPLLQRFINCRNTSLGILSAISRAGFFILLGSIKDSSLVYLAILLGTFGQYLFVVHRAVLSQLVGEEEQGRAMTLVATVDQLANMLGDLFFGNMYPVASDMDMPGLVFVIAGGLALIPGIAYGVFHFILPFDKKTSISDKIEKEEEVEERKRRRFAKGDQGDEETKPLLKKHFDT